MNKTHKRIEYEKHLLSETDIKKNPFVQLADWWNEAKRMGVQSRDAAHLATVGADLRPDARIVLIKDFDNRGLVFYTNYESQKASQIAHNPCACLLIFWPEQERQIRIRGMVKKTSRRLSLQYFKTRPRGAQLGAWASPQSQVISSRKIIEDNFRIYENHFLDKDVSCPPHWGGLRLTPDYFEFWQGRRNRLHDRFSFALQKPGRWQISRLAP